MALTHTLHVLGIVVAWFVYGSLGQWWLLVVVCVGVAVGIAANVRLHIAVDRAEQLGTSERIESGPASFEWFASVSGWRARTLEYCARRYESNERALLEKADAASAAGDHESARRYSKKAESERRWADLIRARSD